MTQKTAKTNKTYPEKNPCVFVPKIVISNTIEISTNNELFPAFSKKFIISIISRISEKSIEKSSKWKKS